MFLSDSRRFGEILEFYLASVQLVQSSNLAACLFLQIPAFLKFHILQDHINVAFQTVQTKF